MPPPPAEATAALCFAAADSGKTAAMLWIDGDTLYLQKNGGAPLPTPLAQIRLSARLANVPRRLHLPNGEVVSVADNTYIDRAFAGGGWMHAAESQWRWLLLLLAAAAAALTAFYTEGLPAAGRLAAERVPDDYISRLSDTVYQNLHNEELLRPSRLDETQHQRARRLFAAAAEDYPAARPPLRLHLRRLHLAGEQDTANALALPNGLIVVTDALMNLLSDDELIAVMAHEIGHVYHHHTMRFIVQAAGIAGLVFFLFGDFSGLSAAPIYLANMQYSRDFEREADCYAYRYLRARALPPSLIGAALGKIESAMEHSLAAAAEEEETADSDSDSDSETDTAKAEAAEEGKTAVLKDKAWKIILEALSTHPPTEQRQDLAKHCE